MAIGASGKAIAVTGMGVLLMYSGITNAGVLRSLELLIRGAGPTQGANALSVGDTTTAGGQNGTATNASDVTSSGGNPSSGTTTAQNQALGKQMATAYGWSTGAEWTALNNIVMAESGWDAYAANPSSDARGIAQNINGWSSGYQAGNASQQIAWLLQYIQQRYNDPIAAWQFHLQKGWY